MTNNGTGINKNELYGRYQRRSDEQHKLAMKVAHKALDIGEDMDLNVRTNHNGIGTAGAIGLAAVTMLGGAGIAMGLGALMNRPSPPAEEKIIEKLIPGENTEIEVKPGPMIFE